MRTFIYATYGIDKSDSLKNLFRQFPTQKTIEI